MFCQSDAEQIHLLKSILNSKFVVQIGRLPDLPHGFSFTMREFACKLKAAAGEPCHSYLFLNAIRFTRRVSGGFGSC